MIHGGDLGAAERLHGRPAEGWLDLSTGINPEPYPLPDLAPETWTRLPEAGAVDRLLRAARRHYGASPGVGIVAGPGTQAILQALPGLLGDRRTVVVGPAYGGYADAWGRPLPALSEPRDDAADILIVGRPNNPDGAVWPAPVLLDTAERLHARGGLLILDEAFADALPEPGLGPQAGSPGLLVLRSFGKFFGLAGLRLGFALGEPALIDRLTLRLGAWAVSGPALAVGTAALGDQTWVLATRRRLAGKAARLDERLLATGLAVAGGTPLFRLVESGDATALHRHLAEAGIWTRRFDAYPRWLRIGLPPENGWARLDAALGAWGERPCPASTNAA